MLDFLNAHRADLQYLASLLVGLAMLRLGGGPERAIAFFFTGVMMLPLILFRLWATTGSMMFGQLAAVYVTLDMIALAGFVLVALNANRNYPLWIAGLQLVAVGAHLVQGLVETVAPFAYVLLAVGPSYLQLVVMVIGLVRHRRRLRRFCAYRDWRPGHNLPRLAAALSGRAVS